MGYSLRSYSTTSLPALRVAGTVTAEDVTVTDDLAVTDDVTAASYNGLGIRVLGSGTGTAVNTAANTVLGTFTRQAGEVIHYAGFIVENAVVPWENEGAGAFFNLARTANANEFSLKFQNTTGTNRTLDWICWAVKVA